MKRPEWFEQEWDRERLAAAKEIIKTFWWKNTKDTKIVITQNNSFGKATKF